MIRAKNCKWSWSSFNLSSSSNWWLQLRPWQPILSWWPKKYQYTGLSLHRRKNIVICHLFLSSILITRIDAPKVTKIDDYTETHCARIPILIKKTKNKKKWESKRSISDHEGIQKKKKDEKHRWLYLKAGTLSTKSFNGVNVSSADQFIKQLGSGALSVHGIKALAHNSRRGKERL